MEDGELRLLNDTWENENILILKYAFIIEKK
jgi:hypothetical protein